MEFLYPALIIQSHLIGLPAQTEEIRLRSMR